MTIEGRLVEINDFDLLRNDILNNQVTISNQAARAAHGFTLREKRVVMAGVSKLDPRKKLDFYNKVAARTFRITAQDYIELAKLKDKTSAYKDMKAACDNLFNRYFRYEIETPRGIKERKHRWVEQVEYQEGQGYVEFTFSQTIMPFLSDFSKQFTRYKLEQTSKFRSIYSWRLLELLLSYTNDEYKEHVQQISVDDLRYQLEIPGSYKYANIKQRVLKPAITELEGKDSWDITLNERKNGGRNVKDLIFTYSRSVQSDLFNEEQ